MQTKEKWRYFFTTRPLNIWHWYTIRIRNKIHYAGIPSNIFPTDHCTEDVLRCSSGRLFQSFNVQHIKERERERLLRARPNVGARRSNSRRDGWKGEGRDANKRKKLLLAKQRERPIVRAKWNRGANVIRERAERAGKRAEGLALSWRSYRQIIRALHQAAWACRTCTCVRTRISVCVRRSVDVPTDA